MTEKFLKLMKDSKPQVQEALRILNKLKKKKKFIPRDITIKQLKQRQREKNFKPPEKKKQAGYNNTTTLLKKKRRQYMYMYS